MKRCFSLLVVSFLCLSMLFGCTAKDSSKSEGEPAKSEQSSTVSSTPSSEPSTVRVYMATTRKEDANTALIKEQIKKDTGIDYQLIANTTDNWEQKFTLLLSSGEKMDIMVINPIMYNAYATQGAFKDISSQYEKYPNLVKQIPKEAWERIKVNNKVLGVPTVNTEGKNCLYIRQDWLDKLGLKSPVTLDDFYNVMKAFTTQDPDGNGIADTVGYSNGNFDPLYGAFGVQPGYYTIKDEKISTNSISDNYKNALKFIKKLYDEKYMDPESFIIKAEQLYQKCINNKVGAFTSGWSTGGYFYSQYNLDKVNPKAKFSVIAPPKGPQSESGMKGLDKLQNVVTIHKDSKVSEAALKLCDYMLTDYGWRTTKYGVEGLHWSMDKNNKVNHVAGVAGKDLKGAEVTMFNMEVYSIFIMRADLYPERFYTSDTYSDASKEGFINAGSVPLIRNTFVGIVTDESNEYTSDITKYEDEMRMKFILGDESFDNWDKYVTKWKELGGEKVRQSLLKVYNQKNNKNYAFLEK